MAVVHLYTLTYNEEKILPFFFQHYEKFVDKFFIYDNMSTDGTIELCKARKDTKVIPWDSKGKMDSFTLTEMRNKIWKKSKGKADFVIVCDADEFLHFNSSHMTKTLFTAMKRKKFSVLKPLGYGMVAKNFPVFGVMPITELVTRGIRTVMMDKCVVFNPNMIEDMNFGLGSHHCLPEGQVKVLKTKKDSVFHPQLLHYKSLGLDYALERKKLFKKRVPKKNVKMGISKHYFADDKQFIEATNKAIKRAKVVV
jgi:hypothetical protein